MTFLALPFSARGAKAALSDRFGVQGIPTLVFVDAQTGELLTKDGRTAISANSFIADFPYRASAAQLAAQNAGASSSPFQLLLVCAVLYLVYTKYFAPAGSNLHRLPVDARCYRRLNIFIIHGLHANAFINSHHLRIFRHVESSRCCAICSGIAAQNHRPPHCSRSCMKRPRHPTIFASSRSSFRRRRHRRDYRRVRAARPQRAMRQQPTQSGRGKRRERRPRAHC